MPIDHAIAFVNDPAAFIANNVIALEQITADLGGAGVPAGNNVQRPFILLQATQLGVPAQNTGPMLRMQPAIGGYLGVTRFDAWYCNAGHGGHNGANLGQLPYVDIRQTPLPADPKLLFTVAMNGCTLVVVSAVPAGAPALAPWHYRVFHDWDHNSLATWHAAGYTVRFAAYAGADEPGQRPLSFLPNLRVRTYNPHNYPWVHFGGRQMPDMRVVTNFLHHDGAAWYWHSRHYHSNGQLILNQDAVPVGGASSTQSLPM